jgi:5-methylcytosine-specific restriction endonuclease McrA
MITKKCRECELEYPETREYFGQYKNVVNGLTKIGYRNSCRKCIAKRSAKHSAENQHLLARRRERRSLLEKNAEGNFTDLDIQKIRNELVDSCRFCAKPLYGEGEIEHLTPLSRGGTSYPRNLTLSCLSCNREKTKKTLLEYIEWREERGLTNRTVFVSTESPDEPTVNEKRNSHPKARINTESNSTTPEVSATSKKEPKKEQENKLHIASRITKNSFTKKYVGNGISRLPISNSHAVKEIQNSSALCAYIVDSKTPIANGGIKIHRTDELSQIKPTPEQSILTHRPIEQTPPESWYTLMPSWLQIVVILIVINLIAKLLGLR